MNVLLFRLYESLSCLTMMSVIPMVCIVLLSLYFVTKQTQSNLDENKSGARPASQGNGSMLSHPYMMSLLLSVTAVFLLQYFIQHNINVSRLVEEQRLMGGKELMKKDFSDWLSQDIMKTGGSIDVEFGNLKEFHRCKSLEDVDQAAFKGIVDNMAKVLEISDDRREEIQMAQHAQSMVNVIEDFEHGPTGFYTYGKYQTLKRTNGNMDIVFALHAFKWKLENKVEMGDKDKVVETKKVNMRERNVWKHGEHEGEECMETSLQDRGHETVRGGLSSASRHRDET